MGGGKVEGVFIVYVATFLGNWLAIDLGILEAFLHAAMQENSWALFLAHKFPTERFEVSKNWNMYGRHGIC